MLHTRRYSLLYVVNDASISCMLSVSFVNTLLIIQPQRKYFTYYPLTQVLGRMQHVIHNHQI